MNPKTSADPVNAQRGAVADASAGPTLYAIADLHLALEPNRAALERIAPHPQDWLVLAGDLCERVSQFEAALALLAGRFARVVWVPGNHDLWTTHEPDRLGGEAKYRRLVDAAQSCGVLTPEDPYPVWPGDGRTIIAPLFLLYDYSFRPETVAAADVVGWARAARNVCADERLLSPAPHASRAAWCRARVAATEARLAALPQDAPTVLLNHYPLEAAHAVLPALPRFSPWCGTTATAGWSRRFRARAVVYGHLHRRRRFVEDGCAFHEVSLGYPGQWNVERPIEDFLRPVLGPGAS